jgi:hypothetical protein
MFQGDLDSLCGLYAVINAVRKAAKDVQPIRDEDCIWLFNRLIATLDDQKDTLRHAVIDGLTQRDVGRLLAATNELVQKRFKATLSYQRPFWRKRNVGVKSLCRLLAFHEQEPATALLVGFSEHWSVIDSITRSGLRLLDSSNYGRLPFNKLAVTYQTHLAKRHCLQPSCVWLLRYSARGAGTCFPVCRRRPGRDVSRATDDDAVRQMQRCGPLAGLRMQCSHGLIYKLD